ncbi:LexA family transcriptional regulator [Sinomicrobium sp. M5D2P9]
MNTVLMPENSTKILTETTALLKRLKELIGIRTDVELSEVLGIKPNTLSTWKKRNTLDYKKVLTACYNYRLDINKLFFSQKALSLLETDSKKGFLVVPREVYYPYVNNLRDPLFINSLPRFDFPFISGKKIRAFQIIGSGMSPRLEDGDFVVGEYVKNTNSIVSGHIYVLISKIKGIFINRVEPDPNFPGFLHLINDKKLISPQMRMATDEIVELWKVTSVFSLDFIEEEQNDEEVPAP